MTDKRSVIRHRMPRTGRSVRPLVQTPRKRRRRSWRGPLAAPRLEALRDAWLAPRDLADCQLIAAHLQAQAFEGVPFLPLGQFFRPIAWSRSLTGGLQGMPLSWNMRGA